MAKADILNTLYTKERSPLEFKFDSMIMNPMSCYLTQQDIQKLNNIATSIRYSSKIELKYKMIDNVMTNRGFKKFHCGTNRIVYRFYEDQSFLVKIALDKVGMKDNPNEYKNQFLLKPFVTKIFEVSPCGTVATVERVDPITSREEFLSIAPDIFELINNCIIGKYVLEDIGTKYFMNWGLRKGFGAVLLDFPYVYKLDGNKLYCNFKDKVTGEICDGVIDYDDGFNNLVCTKCNKRYYANQLEESISNEKILIKDDDDYNNFNISLTKGNKIVKINNKETDYIIRR